MIRFAAAAAIAAVLFAAPALADTSGSIKLSGTVAQTCTVAVTDAQTQLNILAGSNNVTVGSVVETCNDGAGYTITVASTNGGSLRGTSPTVPPVSYTTIYDGQSGTGTVNVTRSSAQFGKTATVAVTVPANAQAIAGSYSDTLTITIAGK
ncbi:hypothetical protein UAJ10_21000 [Nitrospirillum sp. BR 11164]|uniref:hypothetical protein n=1 Tax=Nitrospirillum sp. BR 11164 TaxID=3104324 RepID=UPI002AFE95E2|nr:hypothetical protein [Nitrospirillum sp. BR 11164]MEA1651479.1 hypothetical protein [Nitrospirillum sp. BR 11164]